MIYSIRSVSALSAFASFLLSGAAFAQTATPPATSPAPAATTASGLEEIEVTADRMGSFSADYLQAGSFRNARVIDTPLTVSVITRAVLDDIQATSILDALQNTAGVTSAQINASLYNNLSIRGITVENRGNYRLDGTLPVVNLIDLPIEDKDRVEVLKGASALYYGFTTPAGIVNLTMKRPTEDPIQNATLFGNNNGAIGGAVDLSRTWGDYGLRVNGAASTVSIGVNNTYGQREFASAAFDWKPASNFLLRLDGEWIYKTESEPYEFSLPAAVGGVIPLPALQDPSKNLGARWMYGSGYEFNFLSHAQYNISSDWSLSLDLGNSQLNRDRRYSAFQNYNLITGNGTLAVTLTRGNLYNNVIARSELAGAFDTGPVSHEIVFGYNENIRDSRVPTNPTVNFAQNLYNPVAIPYTSQPVRSIPNPSVINDTGYYVFDRAKLYDWLQLLGGARYTNYTDKFAVVSSNYKLAMTTYSYGAVVKPFGDWVSFYGTFIQGLEEGGVAPATAINSGQELPAGVSKQTEGGVKLQPFGTLLLQAAYFDINRPSSFLNTAKVYVQAGRADYNGFEFSASGEIMDGLSVIASTVLLDAKQVAGSTALITGMRIENTAKVTGSVLLSYKLPFLDGLSITGGAYYVGNRAVNAANNAFVPGYTTYDLGAAYTTSVTETPVTFRINAENVTNKWYWAATGSSLLSEGLPTLVKMSISAAIP